jgi:hypothetical protein
MTFLRKFHLWKREGHQNVLLLRHRPYVYAIVIVGPVGSKIYGGFMNFDNALIDESHAIYSEGRIKELQKIKRKLNSSDTSVVVATIERELANEICHFYATFNEIGLLRHGEQVALLLELEILEKALTFITDMATDKGYQDFFRDLGRNAVESCKNTVMANRKELCRDMLDAYIDSLGNILPMLLDGKSIYVAIKDVGAFHFRLANRGTKQYCPFCTLEQT